MTPRAREIMAALGKLRDEAKALSDESRATPDPLERGRLRVGLAVVEEGIDYGLREYWRERGWEFAGSHATWKEGEER